MGKKGEKLLTVRQVAELTGAAASSIRVWLSDEDARKQRFPGARKESSPIGDYWLIPESDVKDYKNPGKGRPRKTKPK
jgi:predicted DNA-binding transcriptional regulator AlpA